MNEKEFIQMKLKNSDLIAGFYKRFTPSNVVYDTNHKNWHISEGASYGSTIRLYYGTEMLKEVIKQINISLVADKLRQDKKQNKYFWIGMKLASKAEN